MGLDPTAWFLVAILGIPIWFLGTRYLAEVPGIKHGRMYFWWLLFATIHVWGGLIYILYDRFMTGYNRKRRLIVRLLNYDRIPERIIQEAMQALDPSDLYEPEVVHLMRRGQFEDAYQLACRKRDLAREMGNKELLGKYVGLVQLVLDTQAAVERRLAKLDDHLAAQS